MFLIIISSLVSLLTIFILFFRMKTVFKRNIPSWFLGKETNIIKKNNILLSKPPIIPLIIIILVTILFAICYYPKKQINNISNTKSALIWLDPSFQSKLSRKNINFSPTIEAEKLLELGYNYFGLESQFKIINGRPKTTYKVVSLNNKKDISEFLFKQNNLPPSPFIQSIHTEDVIKILNNEKNFNYQKNALIAYSDGLLDSIEGLYSLKKFFNNAILIKSTPYYENIYSEKEIIPSDLFTFWKENKKINTDFAIYDSNRSNIPDEARPHFYIKNYSIKGEIFSTLKSRNNNKILPLIIACTNRYPSPIELDIFSSIRTFVSFFGNEFIEKKCEREINNSNETKNIWKYRNSSLWIVPTNDKIISTMDDDLSFWLPEGFNLNFDTLVYTAGNNENFELNEENRSKKTTIQLDNGAFPISIYLAPLPPGAELGISFVNDSRIYKGIFKPFTKASDGTLIAWKVTSLPFFYLRTATSSPNGELGKSRTWTNFWFEAANNLKQSNLFYTNVELNDVNKLEDNLEDADVKIEDKFSKILDLNNLNFVETDYFTLGLYKLEKNDHWLFFSSSKSDKNNIFVSEKEFSDSFSSTNENVKSEKFEDKSMLSILSTIFCLILLFLLWKNNNKLTLLIVIFQIIFMNNNAISLTNLSNLDFKFFQSQNSESNINENSNIPFRIAWCSKNIPAHTLEKYNELRNILKQRSTINLPKKLMENACSPGEAEIWWSDNPSEILPSNLEGHISNGGIIIVEGNNNLSKSLKELNEQSIGMEWESPQKRGMFYRSFYLLQSIDGCPIESTKVLMLRKKSNSKAPYGLVTSARFLSQGKDCFQSNYDLKIRSFINIIFSFLTTDYKEDQIQLPEILNRIRNLGLEP